MEGHLLSILIIKFEVILQTFVLTAFEIQMYSLLYTPSISDSYLLLPINMAKVFSEVTTMVVHQTC